MNGVNLAEATHIVNVLPAVNTTGGVTGQAFSMKGADHVSILITFGATTSPPVAPTSIVINQCTSAAGANATPLASFRYYYQLLGGAGNDILNGAAQALANTPSLPPNYTTSTAGITSFPATVANLVYVIEIDAAELEAIADVVGTITEYPYLQVVIANGANATYGSVIAVLSGLRYAYKVGATATT
jgi:hypothetical protein